MALVDIFVWDFGDPVYGHSEATAYKSRVYSIPW